MGDEDAFEEDLSNGANSSFEEYEEEVVVSESFEETQDRLVEAKRAQVNLAREREKQRRARAAQRSVGFVEETEFNTTMNAGSDNDFVDQGASDNEVLIFPDEETSRVIPRTPIMRPPTFAGLLRGAGVSVANKRKDRGSTSSNFARDEVRRIRPRPLTTSQTFPMRDWPLGMTADMVFCLLSIWFY